jgi:UDP-GlcNAc:undecaprenyl-phosphate/decaprenyl-phosphate GlcNAc-1-phosphate transferase
MAGGLFGFLRFNTHPATVFMGDAGSQLIGFLSIVLSLGLTQSNGPLSPLLPLLLLGFPVVDTLMVTVERHMQGRPLFVADKNHFHHKLMALGLYHSESVLMIYMIQMVLATFGFLFRFYSEWVLLLFYAGFTGPVFIFVLTAGQKAWRIERPGFLDRAIKIRFRTIKDDQPVIKLSFQAMRLLLPLLPAATALMIRDVPSYISALAGGGGLLLFLSQFFFKKWADSLVRPTLYLLIPYLIYFSETDPISWATGNIHRYFPISFGILAVFVMMTIKFTRRKTGFKTTPMDYLILFAALIIPNLPDPSIEHYAMGMIATKVIVLWFGCEVWIGELRGRLNRPAISALATLLILAARGFF